MIKKEKFKRIIALALLVCMSCGALTSGSAVFAAETGDGGILEKLEEDIISPKPMAADVPEVFTMSENGLPIYEDESYSFEERAADILARLTSQEKLQQMVSGHSPAIPRLGIGWWGWWNECLHGISRYQNLGNTAGTTTVWNTTSYPIPLSMGGTWDTDIMYRVAQAIGEEARETADGNYRNLNFYTPTVNLSRDPRWGRGDESQGEDPFQSAAIASQFVNGLEGKTMDGELIDENGYYQALTTLKHYTANNTENNRVNGTANMSERDLREYYTDVYRRIIEQADPGSVMSSYGRINEVPSTTNVHTLETLLRQTFGFTGFVTTDCDSMGAVIQASRNVPYGVFAWDTQPRQGGGHAWRPKAMPGLVTYAEDEPKNAVITNSEMIAWSSFAGTDVECNGGVNGAGGMASANAGTAAGYSNPFGGIVALNQETKTPMGTFTENQVDINTHRLLTARMKTGEFDRDKGIVSWYDGVKERIANEYGADWTFVNDANNGAVTMTPQRLTLAREAAAKSLVLLKNDSVEANGDKPLLPFSKELLAKEDLNIAVIGYAANPDIGPSTGDIGYVNGSNDKLQGGYSARFGGEGFEKFVYPYEGIVNAVKAVNPNATVTFTRGTSQEKLDDRGRPAQDLHPNQWQAEDTEQVEQEIKDAATEADVVIVYTFTNLNSANEERDRGSSERNGDDNFTNSNLALSSGQTKMIEYVKEVAAEKMILVMETSGPNYVEDFEDGIPAMLFSSFNGQEKGNALADVLLGKYNPSARTSITWFKEGQLTHLLSYKMAPGADTLVNYQGEDNSSNTHKDITSMGRTYMYFDEEASGEVMYPFGYGLSYSTFVYSNLSISDTDVDANDTLTVKVTVTNTGSVAGSTVPQLYVKTPESFGDQYPIKRLRGFEMVKLDPGKSKQVTMTLPIEEFKFFNDAADVMKFEVKPGTYTVQVSDTSDDADVIKEWPVSVSGALMPKVSVVTAKPVIATSDAKAGVPHRLLFPEGAEVDPQLTIAMSDDALYGYVNAMTEENMTGAGYTFVKAPVKAAIPATMDITYKSNRPNIVSVADDGTITATGLGVATITATVIDTVSGSEGTCDFVVYVKAPAGDAPEIGSISYTLDGKGAAVPRVTGDRLNYDVALERDVTDAPTVEAIGVTGDETITVKQAESVPGTAIIDVKDSSGREARYWVHFGYAPKPDKLTNPNGIWRIFRPADAAENAVSYDRDGVSWAVPKEVTQIITAQSSGGVSEPRNIFLQDAIAGDWEATVRVSLSENANGLNAGLVLYTSRTNNAQLVLHSTESDYSIRFLHGNSSSMSTVDVGGGQFTSSSASFAINGNDGLAYDSNEVYLKLVKKGNTLSGLYSKDGETWLSVADDADDTVNLGERYIFPSVGFFAGSNNVISGDPVVTFKNFYDKSVDVLAAPQNISAAGGIGEAVISWDTVPYAEGYAIYGSADGGDATLLGTVDDGSVGAFKATGLAAGIYNFTVQADFGDSYGESSAPTDDTAVLAPAVFNGIVVTAEPDSIMTGETSVLTAAYIGLDQEELAAAAPVDWTVDASGAAQIASIDGFTANVEGLKPGIAKVIATDSSDEDVYGEAYVTVAAPEITGITVDPTELALFVDGSGTLQTTVAPTNAVDKSVAWSSSDETVATVTNGVVKAIAVGTATITATTVNGKTATCEVTVSKVIQPEPIAVTGVSLNKSSTALLVGASEKLTETITPTTAADKTVTWESSDDSVAAVDANGNVKAIAKGEATITVTTRDGGFTDECGVTVTELPSEDGGHNGDGGYSGGGDIIGGGGGGSSSADASISNSNVTFDKNEGADIVVTLSGGDYTLTALKNVSYALTQNTDYTVSGNTVTIKKEYLSTLNPGDTELTFDMSGGADPKLTITITDTSASEQDIDADALIPVSPTSPVNPFTDVTETDWFIDDVIYAYDNDLMSGTNTSPMLFSPNTATTRGMIVTILYRHAGSPNVSGLENTFDDVEADQWYADAVKWAAENEIVSGIGGGKYAPNTPITRQDLAVILMNYMGFSKINLPVTEQYILFPDEAEIADYAKNAIQTLNKLGIISGIGGNVIDPKGDATRAQVAAMLHRFIEAIENK